MKKLILTLAVIGLVAAGAATARAGVNVSIGLPFPVVTYREAPRVYYAAPQPVYVQPAPIVCAPAPVYYAPPAVVVAPPVIYSPRPVARLEFRFGRFHPFYRHERW